MVGRVERDDMRGFAAALRAVADLRRGDAALPLPPAFAQAYPDACARVERWLAATSREDLARELDAVVASLWRHW